MKNISNFNNYIIAEIGTNHNGSLKKTIDIINKISNKYCDCIKFQIYESDEIVDDKVRAKDYNLDSFYGNILAKDMFDKFLKTPKDWFPFLKNLCHKKKFDFAVTIHGENGIRWAKLIKPDLIKIASMDHNNFPFIKMLINNIHAPILVSVGMAKLEDIKILIDLLSKHKLGFGIFHCTSLYPPRITESRISNILYLKNYFNVPIGYSDHYTNSKFSVLAKNLGATFFEKHVTINKKDIGPDHKFSLTCEEFNYYAKNIKSSSFDLKNLKTSKVQFLELSKRENKIRKKYLKSIILKKNIKKNSKIKITDLNFLRPYSGIAPKFLDAIFG